LAASAALGQPALAEPAAVVFGEASPDACLLVRFECIEEALFDD